MTNTTPGREPVQLVELVQPLCANTYGVAPCTAAGGADAKCYNTRATCQDTPNYNISPEHGLGLPLMDLRAGDLITVADLTSNQDLVIAVDVEIAATGAGCFLEIGGASQALYFGITSGRLICRAGDGATGDPANGAKIDVAASSWRRRKGTFIISVDASADTITLYFYNKDTRVVTTVGTATAAGTFPFNWFGTSDGGVGYVEGNTAVDESATDAPGTVSSARIYDNSTMLAIPATSEYNQHLYFSHGRLAEQQVADLPNIIPSLQSVSTLPSKINMNTANPDARGLGNRAVCSAVFQDHSHTDFIVDPYLSGRSWNPLDADRGTFWTRWLVRNKYHSGMEMRIYEGYAGEALSAMRVRAYFVTEITGPDGGGKINIKGKDVLNRLEERKAYCPKQSPGVLRAAITSTDGTMQVANALISEYPKTGIVRIDDEILTYTSVTASADFLVFAGLGRAKYNSTASEHDFDATVQECVYFEEQAIDELLSTLLTTWGGLQKDWLDYDNWATEADDYLSFYRVSALITEDTAVEDLISELQTQCQFYIWWCECSSLVRMTAISGIRNDIPTLTDAANIVAGSYSRKEHERRRLTRVWTHFAQDNYTEDAGSYKAYNTSKLKVNLEAETPALYGSASTKTIFSRWLRSDTLVRMTAQRILSRQVDPPETITFSLDAKDRATWTGDTVYLDHHADVDEFGARRIRAWTIVSAEEIVPGETIKYEAENTTAYGVLNFVMATGAANYVVGGSNPTKNCFIGSSAGLLSDGTASGVIG